MEVFVYDDAASLAAAVASRISARVNDEPGPFSLGLAGGSTPAATYRALAGLDTAWDRVTAWLSDERWVPHDSDRSNGRMASEALFDHVPAALIRPEWSADLEPDESAARYGRLLAGLEDQTGQHDLVLLGLGDDGHTASLFPGSPALDETRHRYVANVIPESGEVRLTATYPLLRECQTLVFLVVGDSKSEALRLSLEGQTPAGQVEGGRAVVEWHVDRQAASQLS